MTIITDLRCTDYHQGGHPERPERISESYMHLAAVDDLDVRWAEPTEPGTELLERAHTPDHLSRVRYSTLSFDSDTPAHEGIYRHAIRSAGGATDAMTLALSGEHAFSLLRPPGHHATRNQAMGFCYLNSIAISALEAQARGVGRVAVFDFDVHHGNGTEDILVNRENCLFASVHQSPCYPGTGTASTGGNCFNFPARPFTQREPYRELLEKALETVVAFQPDLIAVSAGFDAFVDDPIAQETLEPEDFEWIGKCLREIGIPFYSVLEGGYSNALPRLIEAYLNGVCGRLAPIENMSSGTKLGTRPASRTQ